MNAKKIKEEEQLDLFKEILEPEHKIFKLEDALFKEAHEKWTARKDKRFKGEKIAEILIQCGLCHEIYTPKEH